MSASNPRFNLILEDIEHVQCQTLHKGNEKENPLPVDEGQTIIWLTIDNERPPIESQKFQLEDISGNISNKSHRKVDYRESNLISETFIPLDDVAKEYQSYAGVASQPYGVTTDQRVIVSKRNLCPGKWKYTLIGKINFIYQDDNGRIEGYEMLTVNLVFWIDVATNKRKFDLTCELPDDSPGYYLESEVMRPN